VWRAAGSTALLWPASLELGRREEHGPAEDPDDRGEDQQPFDHL
jgi:hypothetical protein